jgi:hypothetical protein
MNAADVKAKTVAITLQDGKERHLRFTLNALAELEERFGSTEAAFSKVENESSVVALRAILWAGLLWEEPDLTEFDVGNLIDINYMSEMLSTLTAALSADMPDTSAGKLPAGDSPNV